MHIWTIHKESMLHRRSIIDIGAYQIELIVKRALETHEGIKACDLTAYAWELNRREV